MAVGDVTTETTARLTFSMSDGTTDQYTIPYPVNDLVSTSEGAAAGVLNGEGKPLWNIAQGYANTNGATIDGVAKVEQVVTMITSVSETLIEPSNE